jgi:class 3 adenylate cyclase
MRISAALLPDGSAERRHLTVMFCDLVGSTSLAAKLDAEDWRDLVSAYLDAASAAVTQMGGRVAKKLGDGLMALFGYPIAQENDSERAVRAALADNVVGSACTSSFSRSHDVVVATDDLAA